MHRIALKLRTSCLLTAHGPLNRQMTKDFIFLFQMRACHLSLCDWKLTMSEAVPVKQPTSISLPAACFSNYSSDFLQYQQKPVGLRGVRSFCSCKCEQRWFLELWTFVWESQVGLVRFVFTLVGHIDATSDLLTVGFSQSHQTDSILPLTCIYPALGCGGSRL